ncbi:MAG TPA: methionine--tRNA ligase [Candidatus Absconditabacterales bacterium]|nr:methionine--tRNA ligase [Candidatus Absconditabacterales bacterium]
MSQKKFYITTAIAYPNGKPHMGHALEIIIADTLARMHRMSGKEVEFQTGTDEHGIKNRRTAQKEGKDILEFLDENVSAFQDMYKKLKVSYNTFLRTSDKTNHYPGVQKIRKKMADKGDIYKQSYSGLYCAGCESFKTEKDLVNGKCADHPNQEIEKVEEENYFFKLSKYKDQVIDLIKKDEYKVFPEIRKNEMLAFLENSRDVSFSRPKTSLPWGIPVPNDEEHIIYVWCDALSNYLTGQGYGLNENWKNTRPADLHIVGKDIQRFHAAFWPAMLLSADIDVPKELLAHGFLTLNSNKMGKSTGNTIDPMEAIEKYGRDPLVFNLLYDVPSDGDGDFSMSRLNNVYNSMLIGSRGNLVNRVTKLSEKFGITNGKLGKNENWFKDFNINTINDFLKNHDTKGYLEKRYHLVQKTNEYITKEEPWTKYKDDSTKAEAVECLEFLLYIVKNLTVLSAPILVESFEKIKNILGTDILNGLTTDTNGSFEVREKAFNTTEFNVNIQSEIIYPRIEE